MDGGAGTLSDLAGFVGGVATSEGIEVVVAHSAASIVASRAATEAEAGIRTVISLEGNLTEADAYFSGQAADHESPAAFVEAFLGHLDQMPADSLIARYRARVAEADPHALWVLGGDVASFSVGSAPGELLQRTGSAAYLYNPENCAPSSLEWLADASLTSVVLPGASHWPTIDAPDLVARTIRGVLAE